LWRRHLAVELDDESSVVGPLDMVQQSGFDELRRSGLK
jgi:hypothetical protein